MTFTINICCMLYDAVPSISFKHNIQKKDEKVKINLEIKLKNHSCVKFDLISMRTFSVYLIWGYDSKMRLKLLYIHIHPVLNTLKNKVFLIQILAHTYCFHNFFFFSSSKCVGMCHKILQTINGTFVSSIHTQLKVNLF